MARYLCTFLLLLTVTTTLVASLKCASSACDAVFCAPAPDCKSDEVLRKGGHCLCCDVCKKIIGVGEYCGSGSPIGAVISNTVECDKGLRCIQDKCQKNDTN